MAVFEIRNLNFTYPECESSALWDISLSLKQGEVMVLCGPSGCGKSTLLRHLKSVLSPCGNREGEIFFEGEALEQVSLRRQASEIGFVSQSPENQIVTDKVWHELAFGLESLGYDTPTIRARVAETAAFFGIENWFYKNVTELSGGQKQLLVLASVMVMNPSVLIMDEPTGQLDPIAASEFLGVVGKINRELGTTILLTEHRLEEAFAMAHRVCVMEKGSVYCVGTPKEVGKILKCGGHQMFLAMPSSMRIWAALSKQTENSGRGEDCPVTVAEGRKWLIHYAKTHSISSLSPENIKERTEVVVSMSDVWFRYEKEEADVIKGLNLNLYQGEFLAILGGNGAGKTTALKLISGLKKPYRGEVRSFGKVVALPQNPEAVFVKKTVAEDLADVFSKTERKRGVTERIEKVAALCRLEGLLDRHPYDLSGGEKQRAALAKMLLLEPDILLLDEPTKGFDAEFKREFGSIIRSLQRRGTTILMVSHDVEFCASYAERCALFFDGNIVSEGTPRTFFSGNSFYTTYANRMAREALPQAVTAEEIIVACGGEVGHLEIKSGTDESFETKKGGAMSCEVESSAPESHETKDGTFKNGMVEMTQGRKKDKLPLWRKVIVVLSGAIALGLFFYATGTTDLSKLVNAQGMTAIGAEQMKLYGVLVLSLLVCFVAAYQPSVYHFAIQTEKAKRRLTKRTIVATTLILLLIPFTLYVGAYYLDSKQYYITAFLVLAECMLPFFLVFEGRKPQARELVTIASLCAMGVAGRAAFFMLPQFKPVAALTIVSGIAFGGEAGFLVGAVTMLTSNILFSQGPWTPFQMFAMGIIGFLAGILFRKGWLRRTKISMCLFGGVSVLVLYGGIMNPAAALIWGGETLNKEILMTYYLTGFPMDLIHGAATVIFLWVGAEPMLEKLDRIKVKYGLVE